MKAHEYVKLEGMVSIVVSYLFVIDIHIEKTRGFIPTYGLLDTKVIRDVRFRLGVALRDAGLERTVAGREMVQKLHPRPHLAIHGII